MLTKLKYLKAYWDRIVYTGEFRGLGGVTEWGGNIFYNSKLIKTGIDDNDVEVQYREQIANFNGGVYYRNVYTIDDPNSSYVGNPYGTDIEIDNGPYHPASTVVSLPAKNDLLHQGGFSNLPIITVDIPQADIDLLISSVLAGDDIDFNIDSGINNDSTGYIYIDGVPSKLGLGDSFSKFGNSFDVYEYDVHYTIDLAPGAFNPFSGVQFSAVSNKILEIRNVGLTQDAVIYAGTTQKLDLVFTDIRTGLVIPYTLEVTFP